MTPEAIKEMRERAIAWASDRGGNLVTRERAIGEDHMALDVLDLIAELATLRTALIDARGFLRGLATRRKLANAVADMLDEADRITAAIGTEP